MPVAATQRSGPVRAAASPTPAATNADIRLRCPRCSANLASLYCTKCRFQLTRNGEIVGALPPERAAHYAQFIRDYEQIRSAEGRGSADEAFYLGLPFCDVSGKNGRQWQIRSRTYTCLLETLRGAVPAGSRILDLGAGNCWLSFRLTRAGYKTCAVDLATNSFDGLEAVEHYRGHLPGAFPRFQAELARLPFQDNQFDAAIFNASFHYAEDAEAAMREALRCVRAGGIVFICDSPWYSRNDSGRKMVAERRASFLLRHGTASASIESVEFLTDDLLQRLAERLKIRWTIHRPRYGLRWKMRPVLAALRGRREPATFRIYAARKAQP